MKQTIRFGIILFILSLSSISAYTQIYDSVAQARKNTSSYLDAYNQQLLGNIDKAVSMYEQHLEKFPTDDAAFYQLARIYTSKGEQGIAGEYARRAVAINPDQDWYQLLLADIYKNSRQIDKAIGIMEKLVKKRPDNLEYIDRLALAYALTNQYKKALEQYQILEEKTEISEELSIQKQKLWLLLDEEDKAIEEIQNLSNRFPDEVKYYSMLAELYLKNNEREKALEAYQNVKRLNPNDEYIHISMADYYMDASEYDRAIEELKLGFAQQNLNIDTKIQVLLTFYSSLSQTEGFVDQLSELASILVKAHPNDAKAYSVYGDMLNQQDNKEQARDAYEKVIQLDSSRYFIWEQLLFIYNSLQQNEKLYFYSGRATELFPMQPIPYLFRGIGAFSKKNYDESLKFLNKGKDYVYQNDALLEQFYIFLGDAYNEAGNIEKSDESYDRALSLNPKNAYVMNNYSYYLTLRGVQLEKARQMAKMANEIEKNNANYMDTYGWVLYQLGEYKDAEKWLKKAIDLDSKNGTLLEHYGDILFRSGKDAKALKYWKKAKETGEFSDKLEQKIKDKKLYE